MFRGIVVGVSLLLAATFVAGQARAANEGQADLDKATDTKLNATTISDLGEVIRLTEDALRKGLDPVNTDFANMLLASTLLQRAQETVKQILAGLSSVDDLRQRRDSALADAEKAVKLDAKQPQAYLLIAQLNLLPGGEVKRASEAIDKALDLGLEDPPARAKALVLRAGLQEQPEKKLADLDEAVRLAPGNANIVRTRGMLRADMGKMDLALADLNKAIELDPDNSPTHIAKSLVLGRMKKYDEALAALDAAHKLSPKSLAPLVQRARVHSTQVKLDEAAADLTQALAIKPNNVAVLLMRASVYQTKGDKQKALADVDQALEIRPNLPIALRTRALVLVDLQRFDEATDDLEKIRKLHPKDTPTLLQLAILYGMQKKTPQTIECYTAALAINPNKWQALRGRGEIYLSTGRQTEAVADYEKALKLQPKDHNVLNNLAWIMATSPDAKLRDGRRAVELATLACEATEYKAAYILSTLAAAYAESGDFDNAVKWAAKAVELGNKEQGDQLKQELESYKAKQPWRELLSAESPAEQGENKPAAKP